VATTVTTVTTEPEVIRLSDEDGRAFFDATARELLGIGGDDFLRRWRAGDYDDKADDPDHWDVLYLAIMGAGDL
jgi:hypothetical protein